MTAIRVAAPATTANLGPGYDCLGMALDIWNTVEVEPLPDGEAPSVSVSGEGAGELENGPENLVYRSMEFLYRELGRPMPPLRVRCDNEIPLARGLGSSAAAIAGGLAAANALANMNEDGGGFVARDLLEMAATIEGHPDNVAAAVMGGLQLVVTEAQDTRENTLYTVPVSVPAAIHAVLFIPETRIATADARAVLPQQLSVADAVHNMARVALLVAGMATNHPEYLSVATQDKLHQPYRQPLFPAMKLLMKAALDAGALGAFLSGSGSTVLALTQGREMTVAYEMAEAARQASVEGTVKVTQPTALGAHLVS
ncbi:MAG: homoserine kinase [Chloroflexi bacterium]|nr:homoserine kinase [Chloroflexota bacterium]